MLRNIVLMGAMPQEIAAFNEFTTPGVRIHTKITGIGKPNAAMQTQKAIYHHNPDLLIFTGVAGALHPQYRLGDVYVGDVAIDADIDVRTLGFARGQIPYTQNRIWQSDHDLVAIATELPLIKGRAFVATGSKFLDAEGKNDFLEHIDELAYEFTEGLRKPTLYEMEGSAFLQVCNTNHVPGLLIRAVSDTLTGDAVKDFNAFIETQIEIYLTTIDGILDALYSKHA